MAREWYYTKTGQAEVGPVSAHELKQMADAGHLLHTDSVRAAGTDKQVTASQVKGLFATPAPMPVSPEPLALGSERDGTSGPDDSASTASSIGEKTSELANRLKGYYRANPRRFLLGAGVVSLVMMFGCCGGLALIGLLGGKPDTELTADYFPHKPGLDRAFTRKTNNIVKNDGTTIDTRWRMVHKPDATIETIGPPPFNTTESVKYRQADGYVELGLRDGTWEPVLKIGTKPGEGWERNGRSYSFKEFTRYNGAQCAVVLEKSVYQGLKKETLYWYAKSEGLVKQEDRVQADGEMKLLCLMTIEGAEQKSKYDWDSGNATEDTGKRPLPKKETGTLEKPPPQIENTDADKFIEKIIAVGLGPTNAKFRDTAKREIQWLGVGGNVPYDKWVTAVGRPYSETQTSKTIPPELRWKYRLRNGNDIQLKVLVYTDNGEKRVVVSSVWQEF